MKVLIIGGYGTFGFGIAERLSGESGLELILAGRNFEKAKAACSKLSGAATFTQLKLDRNNIDLDFKPDLIVDASGPFQTYSVFDLANYCIEQGIHYADLSDHSAEVLTAKTYYSNFPPKTTWVYYPTDDPVADANDFREMCGEVGFNRDFWDEWPNENVFLGFGLSTCPVLSAIGLREIEAHIGPAADVTIGIAPSPRADLGRNVIAAALNYAGQKKVGILEDGEVKTVAGLTQTRRETICVPGGVPLPQLPFAVADAADALVLTDNFPSLKNIWTGAGTRPIWLHRILVFMSRAIADGVLPKLSPFTGLFYRAKNLFRFGSHRGGMFVRASNEAGDASWNLVAEGDHGPRIPTLPVVALIRKMLRGETPAPGAYSGDELISLADLAPEFAQLDISYGLQYDGADLAVYEAVMGEAYANLPPAIQDLHRTGKGRAFAGECSVTRGRNPLSHIVAAIVGFPKSGENIPVMVTVTPDGSGEMWTRNFGGQTFQSHHSLGTGQWARHVTERFGPMAVHMAILEDNGKLRINTRGWSIFGLPLPKFLRPGGEVFETIDDVGRFVFHVDLTAPIFGRLCKYVGWLAPAESDPKSG